MRGASDDPEALFDILNETVPVQAVCEEEQAAIKKRQWHRGSGGRTMGFGSSELGILEAAAGGRPPGRLEAERLRSRASGPTHSGSRSNIP